MEKIKNPILVYDLAYIIYAAGFASEKRRIEAKHLTTGEVFNFSNRTEMYGKGKEVGGWLKTENEKREKEGKEPYLLEDFEIVDIQEAEPLANTLHTVKCMVEAPIKILGSKQPILGFIDGKDVPLWRHKRSTLLEYKGNRKDVLSPIYKQDIIEYLVKKYRASIVQDHHEADDHVIMQAYNKDNVVVVGIDKDTRGNPVYFYNPDRPDDGIVDGRGFGYLRWDDKKKTFDGTGRKFFYAQWLFGDTVDNYKANCMSEKRWGEKSAYESLKDCRNDKECFEVAREVYKKLYPEPIEVVGWRGDKIVIDWLYVAREIFDLARMKRFPEDEVDVADVFRKYKMI